MTETDETEAPGTEASGPEIGRVIELARGESRLGLLPELGGSVAYWRVAERDLLSPQADPNLLAQKGAAVGAYPLVPYSNRIGGAAFSFEGQAFSLAGNFVGETNSIHGNGWEHVWTVVQSDADRAILLFDHKPEDEARAKEWPFAYRCVQSFVLHDNGFDLEILVVNQDARPQPVGFGIHPFLACSASATLAFKAGTAWENDGRNLPERAVPAEGAWSFATPRVVAGETIDNCFAGWAGHAELAEPEQGYAVTIDADPIFRHLVIYAVPEKSFVAVEPATNMNDAIHHPDVLERGLHVLAPGERISGVIRFRLEDRRG